MHVYTEALSVPNACRYPSHTFGTLRASMCTCIFDIYGEILTATVARMRVVTLCNATHFHFRMLLRAVIGSRPIVLNLIFNILNVNNKNLQYLPPNLLVYLKIKCDNLVTNFNYGCLTSYQNNHSYIMLNHI